MKTELSTINRILIRHAHPVSFSFHLIGLMWGGYFLWNGSLGLAIICFVVIIGIGEFIGWKDRLYIFSPENINKFQAMLIQVFDPFNFLLHIIGGVFFMFGLWRHSALLILFGLTFIPIGHLVPWIRRRKQRGIREMATQRNEFLK